MVSRLSTQRSTLNSQPKCSVMHLNKEFPSLMAKSDLSTTPAVCWSSVIRNRYSGKHPIHHHPCQCARQSTLSVFGLTNFTPERFIFYFSRLVHCEYANRKLNQVTCRWWIRLLKWFGNFRIDFVPWRNDLTSSTCLFAFQTMWMQN